MDLSSGTGIISLHFANNAEQQQFKMFEVSEEMLQQMTLTDRECFEIRGSPSSDAVLVTSSKTYSVRLVESSNTILLIQNQHQKLKHQHGQEKESGSDKGEKQTRTIAGRVSCHYELTEIQPRLHMLKELLEKRLYNGDDEEETKGESNDMMDGDGEDYDGMSQSRTCTPISTSTLSLRGLIQASDSQLYAALHDMNAIEIDGEWRMLNPDYVATCADQILNWVVEADVPIYQIPAADMCRDLSALYPANILTHVLRMHSKPEEASKKGVFELDPRQVCLFRAVQLFKQKPAYPHMEFINAWCDSVPEGGIVPTLDMLEGHAIPLESALIAAQHQQQQQQSSASLPKALTDSIYSSCWYTDRVLIQCEWHYHPASSMSQDPRQRMQQLFTIQPKWTKAQITPYISSLPTPGQTHEQFLLKYARAVTDPVTRVVVYTRR